MMKVIWFAVLLIISSFVSVHAQKYGHVNMGNLLSEMDEVEVGDQELSRYRDGLFAKADEKRKRLEAEVKKYRIDVESGLLSDVQRQELETKLQKMQDELVSYENEIVQKVSAKREELFEPILKKVDHAINEVGKEGGYTMIFDQGLMNGILYSAHTYDLTSQVKEKLGM